ncbi:MAG TPA: sigma-70 family RNA polymerase sigma factor [Capsulimonadaceae bacterium]|nr:sigma-70 family RNA polymerase sigma factor [Capsulimonadaceae bacterium]
MMAELDGRILMAVRTESLDRPADSRLAEEDDLWVARAKTGDEAAYRWLLARYRPHVLRLAVQMLRHEGEAEDAAQEAFIRAFGHIRSFRATARFSTWLYRITVRVCLDHRRLARWDAESRSLDENIGLNSASLPTQEIETRIVVDQLMQRLSPSIRAALVLRELEGMDYTEISKVLDIPVGTVRSRLSAARSQFRALWEAAMREKDNE